MHCFLAMMAFNRENHSQGNSAKLFLSGGSFEMVDALLMTSHVSGKRPCFSKRSNCSNEATAMAIVAISHRIHRNVLRYHIPNSIQA